jgi:hypothetical protein
MLDLMLAVLSIYLLVKAATISRTIWRNSALFVEFEQSRVVGWLVWLMPATPILSIVTRTVFGPLPAIAIAAAACIPLILSAKTCQRAFERSGTDRTAAALRAVSDAWLVSTMLLVFVVAVNLMVAAAVFAADPR